MSGALGDRLALGVVVWHPWVRAPHVVTWSATLAKYPNLAREPTWIPPGYHLVSIQFKKPPPADTVFAFYTKGSTNRSTFEVVEAAKDTATVVPGLHTIRKDGMALQVAQWRLPGGNFTDVLVGFDQNGNNYSILAKRIAIGVVERMALSLTKH